MVRTRCAIGLETFIGGPGGGGYYLFHFSVYLSRTTKFTRVGANIEKREVVEVLESIPKENRQCCLLERGMG